MRLEVQKSLFELVLGKLGKDEPINEVVEATVFLSNGIPCRREAGRTWQNDRGRLGPPTRSV